MIGVTTNLARLDGLSNEGKNIGIEMIEKVWPIL